MSTAPLPPARLFDFAATLEGPTLRLRPFREADIEALHAAAASPAVWAQHPNPDRHRWDVFEPYARRLLALGGTLVAVDRASDAIIGCSRFYVGPDAPDDIAIGFTFLNDAWWGGTTNREMKTLMLGHAFATFDTVWFHIGPANIRSQRATARLGATLRQRALVDLGAGPTDYLCFALARADWAAPTSSEAEAAR